MAETQSIGVGLSRADDPVMAAEEACAQALDGRTPQASDLMVLFATVERLRVGAEHTTGTYCRQGGLPQSESDIRTVGAVRDWALRLKAVAL